MEYLIQQRYLVGEAAASALQYARSTREELEHEKVAKLAIVASIIGSNAADDGRLLTMMNALILIAREILFLMKIGLGLGLVLCFLMLFVMRMK